jgi:hypothetical protein
MKNIQECRFMRTVMADSIINSTSDELKAQYSEFTLLLADFLYSNSGYLKIDSELNDLLFILTYRKGKKK